MSSGGFGLVEGLGWVCLSVARELGLSIAEISASVTDAHDVVFRQTAVQFQQKTLARVQAADKEWEQLRLDREKRLAPIRSGVAEANKAVESDSKALSRLHESLASRQGSAASARSSVTQKLREIHASIGQAASVLSSAPPPASSELEVSALAQCNLVKQASKTVVLVARKIAGTTSSEALKAAQSEVASAARSARSASQQAYRYALQAAKAETEYRESAVSLTRARVGAIMLEESPYPTKARSAAERVTGPLSEVNSALQRAQQDLASGKLQEAKSAAKRYESVVERGQAAALRATVQIAKRQIAQREKLATRKIDVDTSGSIVVKVEDSSKPGPLVGKLKTLIDEVAAGSGDVEFAMPKRDRSKEAVRGHSGKNRGVAGRRLR